MLVVIALINLKYFYILCDMSCKDEKWGDAGLILIECKIFHLEGMKFLKRVQNSYIYIDTFTSFPTILSL